MGTFDRFTKRKKKKRRKKSWWWCDAAPPTGASACYHGVGRSDGRDKSWAPNGMGWTTVHDHRAPQGLKRRRRERNKEELGTDRLVDCVSSLSWLGMYARTGRRTRGPSSSISCGTQAKIKYKRKRRKWWSSHGRLKSKKEKKKSSKIDRFDGWLYGRGVVHAQAQKEKKKKPLTSLSLVNLDYPTVSQ